MTKDDRGSKKSTATTVSARNGDDPRAITALAVFGVIGALGTFSFLPLIVGQAISYLGLSNEQAGALAAAEMGGAGVATFCVAFLVNKGNRRTICTAGLAGIVVGSLVSLYTGIYAVLVFGRILTGLGEGSVVAVVTASMAGTRDPERNYGLWTMGNMAAAALLFFVVMPWVESNWHIDGIFIAFLFLAVVSIPLLMWYPTKQGAPQTQIKGNVSIGILVSLVAILVAFLADGGIWAYMQPLGTASAVPGSVISKVLGAAALAGIAGGLLATWLSAKIGRLVPNASALLLSIASLLIVVFGSGVTAFVAAAMSFYLAWIFGLPYLMGVVAALDPSGRAATFGILMQNIGLAVGPLAVGALATAYGYTSIGWFGVGLYALALAFIAPISMKVDSGGADQDVILRNARTSSEM